MVVKLDAALQGLDESVAVQLTAGSSIHLQAPSAGVVTCSLTDGRTVGFLSLSQVQHLPVSVRSGVVRSLRKQAGRVVEVTVRFTARAVQEAIPAGPSTATPAENYEQGSTRLGRKRLGQLVGADDLRPLLRDERLQKVIQAIDSAPSREQALASALQQPEFAQFCDKCACKSVAMFASLVDALQGPAEQAVDDSASDEDIQGPAEGLQAAPQQSESAAQEPEVLISSPSAPEEETPAAAAASGLQSVDDLAEEDPQIPVTQPEASRTSVPTAAAQRPQQAFSLWGMASALADNVRKNTADIASSVRDTDWRAELEAFKKGVSEDSQVVQQQTAKAIQEGRTKLEHLQAQQAQRRPPHLPRVSPEQLQQLNQVGSRLGKFGATFVSSTRSLFDQVQEGIQQELDGVEDYLAGKGSKAAANSRAASRSSSRAAAGQRYSRLDSEVSAMQRNSATYCDEPQDTADYQAWLQGFDLGSRKGEIEAITGGNAFMAELQSRIVPLIVEYEAFWTRYFFQLHKLQVKHAQRQEVAQRAQRAAAEELAWDDEEPSAQPKGKVEVKRIGSGASPPARHQPKEESELQSTAAVAASVTAAPPLAAAAVVADAAVSEESSPMSVKVAKQGGEDEGLETSTASDDSGQGPWTVVTSPTHARTPSDEVTSPRPRHAATEAAPSCAAAELSTSLQAAAVEEEPAPQAATDQPAKSAGTNAGAEVTKMRRPVDGQAGTGDEDDDLDISDDDGAVAAAGGAESEVDEDWGSWE